MTCTPSPKALRSARQPVIAGLDPAVHEAWVTTSPFSVDARNKSGHDEKRRKRLAGALLAGVAAAALLAIGAERAVAFRGGGFGGFHGASVGSEVAALAVSVGAVSAVFTTAHLAAARALAMEVLPTAAQMPALVAVVGAASTTPAHSPTVPIHLTRVILIGARIPPNFSKTALTKPISFKRIARTPWGKYKTTG